MISVLVEKVLLGLGIPFGFSVIAYKLQKE